MDSAIYLLAHCYYYIKLSWIEINMQSEDYALKKISTRMLVAVTHIVVVTLLSKLPLTKGLNEHSFGTAAGNPGDIFLS